MRSVPLVLRAAGALSAIAVTLASAPAAHAASNAPVDSHADGAIGLCNGSDQNVTGGSVDATPFVWKAVSSTPAPSPQQGTGQNTVLEIYQVRAGVEAQEWSGDQLTATSFYDNRLAPAAQATRADLSLRTIVSEFPPQQDGLYQLRMYFGRVDHGVYSATYPSTFIQVTGDSWHVVAGTSVRCDRAPAVSNELLTGVISRAQTVPPPAADPTRARSHGESATAFTGWGLGGALAVAALCAATLAYPRRRRIA